MIRAAHRRMYQPINRRRVLELTLKLRERVGSLKAAPRQTEGSMSYVFCRRSMMVTVVLTTLLASLACDSTPKAAEKAVSPATNDARTPVPLPAEGQQAVLREMRQMLASIGGALSAAARADTGAVLAALAPAGSAAAADPAIEELLPPTWKELAERTHGGFDSLSRAVRRARTGPALKDTVMLGIARVSGSCTGCHETFRLTVR